METLGVIGSTLGLGFLAGIRLYATVFLLGIAIRLGWFHPGVGSAELMVLAHPAVLIASGLACLVEFAADKIPWLDSLWDSFHTFIRPIGAAVLAAAAFGHFDPVAKAVLIVICGGIALASNSSKAATRLAVNHSPEPFSNIGLSLLEDALIPAGMWVSLKHPEVALGLVAVFMFLFLWLAPRIFRAVRLQLAALGALLRSWFGPETVDAGGAEAESGLVLSDLPAGQYDALRRLARAARPIPEKHARSVQKALKLAAPPRAVRVAATKQIRGLGNSLGYLVVTGDGIAFVTRRWFTNRVQRIPFSEIDSSALKRGLLDEQVRSRDGPGRARILRLQGCPASGSPLGGARRRDGKPAGVSGSSLNKHSDRGGNKPVPIHSARQMGGDVIAPPAPKALSELPKTPVPHPFCSAEWVGSHCTPRPQSAFRTTNDPCAPSILLDRIGGKSLHPPPPKRFQNYQRPLCPIHSAQQNGWEVIAPSAPSALSELPKTPVPHPFCSAEWVGSHCTRRPQSAFRTTNDPCAPSILLDRMGGKSLHPPPPKRFQNYQRPLCPIHSARQNGWEVIAP